MFRPRVVHKEGVAIDNGGKYDLTKSVAPDIIRLNNNLYRLYYVGTNSEPKERSGYQLLYADSKDGQRFQKVNKPLLTLMDSTYKYYSPRVIRHKNKYFLYYGFGSKGKYCIKSAESSDGTSFVKRNGKNINVGRNHEIAVHTPKIFVDRLGVMHCYFTGSSVSGKVNSSIFPQYDVGQGFKIFYANSKDGIKFMNEREIKLNISGIRNFYGHNVLYSGGKLYMIFTGFNGKINKLYVCYSKDLLNFSPPKVLLGPNLSENEMGLYSNCFYPLGKNTYRLFYGVRYTNNLWNIKSAVITL